MLLCHCYKVTNSHIKECIQKGACNLDDVKRACGACTGCGCCAEAVVEQILVELSKKPKTYEYTK